MRLLDLIGHKYPFTDFHELNLDWCISAVLQLQKAFEDFSAGNKLIFANPLQHDLTKTYAKNTIVVDSVSGTAYLSLDAVPVGVQLDNADYWLPVFDFASYVTRANQNFTDNYFSGTDRTPYALAVGDWVVLDDVLYKVNVAMAADDLFIIGTNIIHFTVEQFLKDFVTSVNNTLAAYSLTIQQYKNDIDASELAYRQQLAQDIANTTASLQAQLDQAISGATVDSEVILARIGADGVTYPTLGDAIRTQINNTVNGLNVYTENLYGITNSNNGNLFNYNNKESGFIDYTNGVITANASWIYSPTYAPVTPGDTLYTSGSSMISFYDKFKTWKSGINKVTADTLTVPADCYFIRVSFSGNSPSHYVIVGSTANDPGTLTISPIGIKTDRTFSSSPSINKEGSFTIRRTQSDNLYNYWDAVQGFIDSNTGEINPPVGPWHYSPTYSYVEPGDILRANFSGFYAYYDINGNFVQGVTSISGTKTVPAGCYYVRISSSGHDRTMVVTKNDANLNKGMYYFNTEIDNKKVYTVGPSGCDFTSFTEAIYTTRDSGVDVIVYPGTYQIEPEYDALFTSAVVDAMNDNTDLDGFQMGIVIKNRKVTFLPGSRLYCDWSSHTVSATARFSAIMCGMNCEIEGMRLDCGSTFYCVHEDAGGSDATPYVQKFKNCIITGVNSYNGQCWGGGCGINSMHIIENCFMNNNDSTPASLTGRYHSTGYANGRSIIEIKNSYFNSEFDINYHGVSSTQTRAYISSCYASKGFFKNQETAGAYDNVSLFTWANETA